MLADDVPRPSSTRSASDTHSASGADCRSPSADAVERAHGRGFSRSRPNSTLHALARRRPAGRRSPRWRGWPGPRPSLPRRKFRFRARALSGALMVRRHRPLSTAFPRERGRDDQAPIDTATAWRPPTRVADRRLASPVSSEDRLGLPARRGGWRSARSIPDWDCGLMVRRRAMSTGCRRALAGPVRSFCDTGADRNRHRRRRSASRLIDDLLSTISSSPTTLSEHAAIRFRTIASCASHAFARGSSSRHSSGQPLHLRLGPRPVTALEELPIRDHEQVPRGSRPEHLRTRARRVERVDEAEIVAPRRPTRGDRLQRRHTCPGRSGSWSSSAAPRGAGRSALEIEALRRNDYETIVVLRRTDRQGRTDLG